ncbi:MAG: PfkB family carbohydrate kinase [Candidatus Hadarchaeota archaeon]
MPFDIVIVGHVTVDVNILHGGGIVENMLGGAPTYSGLALVALRKSIGLVSKVGADFLEKFPPIYGKLGLDTEGITVAGDYTTTFENTYDEKGNRTQVCKHVAPQIQPDDIPEDYLDAGAFYVSPIAGEVGPELLKSIKKNSNIVMFDPQGVLREIRGDGRVTVRPKDLAGYLKNVDIVKLGLDEAGILGENVEAAMRKLKDVGPKVVMVTKGGKPSLILSDDGLAKVNPLKVDARDMTGAGDVFGAAFLSCYMETRKAVESAKFAAATAGLKIRYRGPTGFPSEKEVVEAAKTIQVQ